MNRQTALEIRRHIVRCEYLSGDLDPTSKDAHSIADAHLKQWARGWLTHDKREINQSCGVKRDTALGAKFKQSGRYNRINDPAPIEIDDTRYRQLNEIIMTLNPFNYGVLFRHYIERDGMEMKEFLKSIGMRKDTYRKILIPARQEFIIKGGI